MTYLDLPVTYLELPGSYMAVDPFLGVECPILTLCFYVLGAFLPSVPGRARHADLLIKTPPGAGVPSQIFASLGSVDKTICYLSL